MGARVFLGLAAGLLLATIGELAWAQTDGLVYMTCRERADINGLTKVCKSPKSSTTGLCKEEENFIRYQNDCSPIFMDHSNCSVLQPSEAQKKCFTEKQIKQRYDTLLNRYKQ